MPHPHCTSCPPPARRPRPGPIACLLALLAWAATAEGGQEYRDLPLKGAVLHYALVLPDDFDPARTYPVLLALPPGRQDQSMVEAGLHRYWGEQAARREWIVLSPVAPPGSSFAGEADWMIRPLLDAAAETWHVEGGRFHLAGVSNGGRSAFRAAGLNPGRFQTLTVLPGFPSTAEDEQRLPLLRGVVVSMFGGGLDTRWARRMRHTRSVLEGLGVDVRLRVFEGEGHVPPSLDGEVIMEHLERLRRVAKLGALLDDFHAAAADADAARYFGRLAEEAVFIGTDPDERWTREEFRRYAEPRFHGASAWTYVAQSRRVRLAPGGAAAWFDEVLDNEKYGRCRSTGVLIRTEEGWKIAQYALAIPIPNGITLDVVDMIRRATPPPH